MRHAVEGCHEVYHVAAHYSTRAQDAELMFAINVDGTHHVISAAIEAGAEHIVYTSTIGTIGRRDDSGLPTEEDLYADVAGASPYVRSKLAAEAWALGLGREGAPVVVVNPCAPVGPGDIKPTSTGQRIVDYLQGQPPSFPPGGINFVAVEDVAQGHLLAARRGRAGQRYILGNAQGNLTIEGFFSLMERVSAVSRPRGGRNCGLSRLRRALRRMLRGVGRAAPGRSTGRGLSLPDYRPRALTADPSRAIRELGLPQTPLEDAFRQAVTWFREGAYV